MSLKIIKLGGVRDSHLFGFLEVMDPKIALPAFVFLLSFREIPPSKGENYFVLRVIEISFSLNLMHEPSPWVQ